MNDEKGKPVFGDKVDDVLATGKSKEEKKAQGSKSDEIPFASTLDGDDAESSVYGNTVPRPKQSCIKGIHYGIAAVVLFAIFAIITCIIITSRKKCKCDC